MEVRCAVCQEPSGSRTLQARTDGARLSRLSWLTVGDINGQRRYARRTDLRHLVSLSLEEQTDGVVRKKRVADSRCGKNRLRSRVSL